MEKEKISMYDPFTVGDVTVPNRLIRSATFEYGAKDGKMTEEMIELYRKLAQGGVGLIVTGMQAVLSSGVNGPHMIQTSYDGYAEDMGRMAEAVHKEGSRIFVQLNHAGYKTDWKNGCDRLGVTGREVEPGCVYHEATEEEIARIVQGFAQSAKRCKEAGCDGVQIHGAHGYLISTFLSPATNKREDGYGGDIEGRGRLLLETYDAVRAAVGDDYPIAVKLPYADRIEPSIQPEESLWVCRQLEKRGIDLIEVSAGVGEPGQRASSTPLEVAGKEGAFLEGAKRIAEAVAVPVASVCGYRTPDFIEQVLNETAITAISICRPLIREPGLVNRWRYDRTRPDCISCNRCFQSKGLLACQVK